MPVSQKDVERILARTRAESPRPMRVIYVHPDTGKLILTKRRIALCLVRKIAGRRNTKHLRALEIAAKLLSASLWCQNEKDVRFITSEFGPDIIKLYRWAGQLGRMMEEIWTRLPEGKFRDKLVTLESCRKATDEFFRLERAYRRHLMKHGVVISFSALLEGVEDFGFKSMAMILGDEGMTAFVIQMNSAIADLRAILQEERDEEDKKSAQA